MLIAHLSDFHVFAGAKPDLIRPDIARVVGRIVADVAAFRPAIDLCLLTGDLAGNAVPEDYELLRRLLEPLPMPFFAIPGNHDARAPFREAFRGILPFGDGPFLHYEARFRDLRILALDTLDENATGGRLCPERLEWIREKLDAPFAGITYLLMHHAPYTSGVRFLDDIDLTEGREEFAALVRAAEPKPRILCGHIHRPSVSCWNGAFAMVGGSPAFTIELDLAGGAEEPALEEAPCAYFVHHLDESGDFAVSPRFVAI